MVALVKEDTMGIGLALLLALIIATCAAMVLGCVELAIKGAVLFILLMIAFALAFLFLAIVVVTFRKGDNDGDSTDGSSK